MTEALVPIGWNVSTLSNLVNNGVEACLFVWFLHRMCPMPMLSRKAEMAGAVGFVLVYLAVRTPLAMSLVIVTLAAFVLCVGYALASRRTDGVHAVLISSVFLACLEGCWALFTAPLVLGNELFATATQESLPYSLAINLLRMLAFALVLYLVARFGGWYTEGAVPPAVFLVFLEPVLLAVAVHLILFQEFNHTIFDAVSMNRIVAVSLAVAIFVGLAGAIFLLNAAQTRARLLKVEAALEAQRFAFESKLEANDALRRMHHDIKNHLVYLRTLSSRSELLDHVDGIERDLALYTREAYTGIPSYDVVLNEKVAAAHGRGITVGVVMEPGAGAFIDDATVCTVLGNAMDNAIEAAAEVPDADNRLISVRSFERSGVFHLVVCNHFAEAPRGVGGKLRSRKRGYRQEGIGLASMSYSLRAYEGALTYQIEGDRFMLDVAVPVPA